jgi:hypothetical protein
MNFSRQIGMHLAGLIVEMVELDEKKLAPSKTDNRKAELDRMRSASKQPSQFKIAGDRTGSGSFKPNANGTYKESPRANRIHSDENTVQSKSTNKTYTGDVQKLGVRIKKYENAIKNLRSEIRVSKHEGRGTSFHETELARIEQMLQKAMLRQKTAKHGQQNFNSGKLNKPSRLPEQEQK